MKAAIVGSRTVKSESFIIETLNKIYPISPFTTVISGGAEGIDTIAINWAKEKNLDCEIYKPDYKNATNKKLAPLLRNRIIIEKSDIVIVFWDGKSRGTYNALSIAKQLKKPISLFYI